MFVGIGISKATFDVALFLTPDTTKDSQGQMSNAHPGARHEKTAHPRLWCPQIGPTFGSQL